MINAKAAFAGFSVDNQDKAKEFYTKTLGLNLKGEEMGLKLSLPGGGELFIYPKEDHAPATYTVLNFVVDDIGAAVDTLVGEGVKFEQYDMGGGAKTDDKGIMHGLAAGQGPDIAWFKDPAGNTLSIMQVE
jgi:catechol 2,3-dioxygenase-like lactoylglutathione lyase family enzyme